MHVVGIVTSHQNNEACCAATQRLCRGGSAERVRRAASNGCAAADRVRCKERVRRGGKAAPRGKCQKCGNIFVDAHRERTDMVTERSDIQKEMDNGENEDDGNGKRTTEKTSRIAVIWCRKEEPLRLCGALWILRDGRQPVHRDLQVLSSLFFANV